jgi:hypothetical protein
MKIANPIYDVVFKFLMEDLLSAKILLSEVTGLDIVSLNYLPQEQSAENHSPEHKADSEIINLSLIRLDFSAIIQDADGREKLILIELQKSNVNPQIMRFRKYVGKQYTNEQLYRWVKSRGGGMYKKGIPILPIFILGGTVGEFMDVPVLDVDYQLRDRYRGEVLVSGNHFIESLFHKGIIINLRALYNKRRDELEKLLSIFNFQNTPKNKHIMNVKQTDFSDRFQPILRRLQAAIAEVELQNKMDQEDDVLADLNDQKYVIEMARLDQEEGIRMQEKGKIMQEEGKIMQEEGKIMQEEGKIMQEEGKIMQEEGKIMQEEGKIMKEEGKIMKEEARQIKEEARQIKEEARRDQEKAISLLLEAGFSAEEISAKFALPLEKILALRKS